jgi:hypothetical protein
MDIDISNHHTIELIISKKCLKKIRANIHHGKKNNFELLEISISMYRNIPKKPSFFARKVFSHKQKKICHIFFYFSKTMASVTQTKCNECGHVVKEEYSCFQCKKPLATEFALCPCALVVQHECQVCKIGLNDEELDHCEDCGMGICSGCQGNCTMFYCCEEFYEPEINKCPKCCTKNPFFGQ